MSTIAYPSYRATISVVRPVPLEPTGMPQGVSGQGDTFFPLSHSARGWSTC